VHVREEDLLDLPQVLLLLQDPVLHDEGDLAKDLGVALLHLVDYELNNLLGGQRHGSYLGYLSVWPAAAIVHPSEFPLSVYFLILIVYKVYYYRCHLKIV